MPRRTLALPCAALITLIALLAAGCSGLRTIESEVRATVPKADAHGASAPVLETSTPLGPGVRYRFERLPSQAEEPARTEAIEAMADTALQAAGLVRDDLRPRYSVQVRSGIEAYYVDDWGRRYPGVPPYSPAFFGEFGVFVGPGRIGPGTRIGMGWTSWPPTVRYAYAVSLLVRDLDTQRIVYETQASHEGPWGDRDKVLPALLQAALQDFPAPHTGPVKIQIPR